jgi:hypothetical protein
MSDYTDKELKEMADEYHLREISKTLGEIKGLLFGIWAMVVAILISTWSR